MPECLVIPPCRTSVNYVSHVFFRSLVVQIPDLASYLRSLQVHVAFAHPVTLTSAATSLII